MRSFLIPAAMLMATTIAASADEAVLKTGTPAAAPAAATPSPPLPAAEKAGRVAAQTGAPAAKPRVERAARPRPALATRTGPGTPPRYALLPLRTAPAAPVRVAYLPSLLTLPPATRLIILGVGY